MRRVVWFSCGVASAVAAKITTARYPDVAVVYCDVSADEHPDNVRFMADVAEWLGQPVEVIGSPDFQSVDDVFAARRYMAGIAGAPCTVELKKKPRFVFQRPDDVHIFGFTADEQARIERFEINNPELSVEWPLVDAELTKQACFDVVATAGIRLPTLYALGYRNNNCVGCVKATSPSYWAMVRRDFPDVFARRAEQSREYGARLARLDGERVFLDEIPDDYQPNKATLEAISCGPDCQMALDITDVGGTTE